MDTPKTSDPAISSASAGSLVIGNVSSLAGSEDTHFVDGTTPSSSSLIPVDNVKSEFVDDLDFLNLGDLKAEPADPQDIKEIQLDYLLNASTPGDFSSETPALKNEPELTNCLPLKVEPKVESGCCFQTSGHLQSFPKLLNGEISDCLLEPGQVVVPSVNKRLPLFELMSQCRDPELKYDDPVIQTNERKSVHPVSKSNLLNSISLEPSKTLLPTPSQSSEIISISKTLQQKQKTKHQCARKSTVSRKDKECPSRTNPVNNDTDPCSLGIDEDTDGYEMGADSDSDVSQILLGRKNAGNQGSVADFVTEKNLTESVPTIPSKTQMNQLKNNKKGRKGKSARRKGSKKTEDKNDENILKQIPSNLSANEQRVNKDAINHTLIESFENRSPGSVISNNSSRHVNSCEKQLDVNEVDDGVVSDSVKPTDNGKYAKSRKIRKSKKDTNTADATSKVTAVKRKVGKERIRRRKRRKLKTRKSSKSNNESDAESECNDAEVRTKNVRQRKKTKHKIATSESDSENEDNPDLESESQHGEPNSRKVKICSRKSVQHSPNDSASDTESEPPCSKRIGPHKVKWSNVRLGREATSVGDCELSDDGRTPGSESDDTLSNQSHCRSSGKRSRGRTPGSESDDTLTNQSHCRSSEKRSLLGETTDPCESSENDSDSVGSNRSEQVSLGSKNNTNVRNQLKRKDLSSDYSEVGEASSGCDLEEKYASDVRFQPFVRLEKLPDILEMEQFPPPAPENRKVKDDVHTSNRKSNLFKKKKAKTPDIVELVDIDDSASDIGGQSDDNEVTYEPPTPQVHDEELEFLTAAYYGINSSRARRLASSAMAASRKRKKKETRSKESSVITLAENNELEGSEVGDSVLSEERNDSQCGDAKDKSQRNDTDNNIGLDTTTKPVSAKRKIVRKYNRTTCSVCFKELASTESYIRHFQSVHAGLKPFVCKFCGKGFGRKDGLQSHVTSVHNEERPFACKLCGKTYKQLAHLQEHMIYAHDGKRKFICSYCGMGHISKYKLGIHVRIHTGEKPFECEICHQRFAQKISLKSHYRAHSTEKPFICQQCGVCVKTKGSLNDHLLTHSEVRNYKCNVCPLAFKCLKGLRDHMQSHGERNFKCEICNFAFRRKKMLVSHMDKHSGEKQFSCDICNKKFTYKKSIAAHMQRHVRGDEKNYECDLCHKRFYTNSRLKQHKFLHTGERPLACKVCDQRFKTTGGVSQHMMCVHPEEEIERRKTNAVCWVRVDS